MHIKILFPFFFGLIAAFSSTSAHGAVESSSKHFGIGLVAEQNQYNMGLSPADRNDGTEVHYRPNVLASTGLQLTVYDLTVSYKTNSARNKSDDLKKGVTSYEDLRFSLTLGGQDQWFIDTYYTRYGGLYIENSATVDSTYSGVDSFIQRSDLSIFNYGFSAMYVWSPERFSIAAALFQSSRQTESGGSWLTMAALDGSQFSAGSSIIPSSMQSLFGRDSDLTAGKFNTASAAAGYGYTLTNGSLFLTAIALIGPGYQWRQYTASGIDATSSANAMKRYIALAAGFNGETFYAAASFTNADAEYATQSVRFRPALQQVRMIVGWRF